MTAAVTLMSGMLGRRLIVGRAGRAVRPADSPVAPTQAQRLLARVVRAIPVVPAPPVLLMPGVAAHLCLAVLGRWSVRVVHAVLLLIAREALLLMRVVLLLRGAPVGRMHVGRPLGRIHADRLSVRIMRTGLLTATRIPRRLAIGPGANEEPLSALSGALPFVVLEVALRVVMGRIAVDRIGAHL
jgi:hypothetical protein